MPAAPNVALILAPAEEPRGQGSPQRAHDAACKAHPALISSRAPPPAPKVLSTSACSLKHTAGHGANSWWGNVLVLIFHIWY